MKSIWPWILSGICLILACWCNLNTYFINQNTERIEKLEQNLPKNKVDSVYVINFKENKKK